MDDDWETAKIEDTTIPKVIHDVNKWDGEDDDEDVKDNWEDDDDEEEEEKETEIIVPTTVKPSKTQKSELERQKLLEEQEEEERLAKMSPEERKAEALRIVKESDLKLAMQTFSISSDKSTALDAFDPQSLEDFQDFGDKLCSKLANYKDSPHYSQFIEDVVRKLCIHLPAASIKKVKINVEVLHAEKSKLEKAAKKPAAKSKGRATLRTEDNDIVSFNRYGNDYNFDDDFM